MVTKNLKSKKREEKKMKTITDYMDEAFYKAENIMIKEAEKKASKGLLKEAYEYCEEMMSGLDDWGYDPGSITDNHETLKTLYRIYEPIFWDEPTLDDIDEDDYDAENWIDISNQYKGTEPFKGVYQVRFYHDFDAELWIPKSGKIFWN